jgi:DNA-binding CsgD family transcriptional regulator
MSNLGRTVNNFRMSIMKKLRARARNTVDLVRIIMRS